MKSLFHIALASLPLTIAIAACSSDESTSPLPTSSSAASSGTGGAAGATTTSTGGSATGGTGGAGTAGSGGLGGAGGIAGGGGTGGAIGAMCTTDADCSGGLVCNCPNDACHDCGNAKGSCFASCMGG